MIVGGWLDWTVRIDGIADKVYTEPNRGLGIACHSVVGMESEGADGVPDRFLATNRGADGRYTDYAAASCMFVLRRNGTLIQMYPISASTWTSGGREGNTRFWAIEAEGGRYPDYGEKLTPVAEAAFIRLVTEWEAHTGIRAAPGANILQHKDIATAYGYAATACASDRYSAVWARIAAGERYGEMNDTDRARLARLERLLATNAAIQVPVTADNLEVVREIKGGGVEIGQSYGFAEDALLLYLDRMGSSMWVGLANTQQELADHLANHAAGVTGQVTEHTHEGGKVRRP